MLVRVPDLGGSLFFLLPVLRFPFFLPCFPFSPILARFELFFQASKSSLEIIRSSLTSFPDLTVLRTIFLQVFFFSSLSSPLGVPSLFLPQRVLPLNIIEPIFGPAAFEQGAPSRVCLQS